MAAELIFAPEAEEDIAAAYDWYERHRLGLGEDFLSTLDACLAAIRRYPQMHATVCNDLRRGLLRRFPFGVFYEQVSGSVVVYGVLHTSSDPHKWRERMPDSSNP